MLRVGNKIIALEDIQVKGYTLKKGDVLKIIKVAKYSNIITLIKENEIRRYKVEKEVLLSKFRIADNINTRKGEW